MYFDYFGLTENPFTIAPNPRYLYMSVRHQEALAHLLYGVQEGGGFVQLTGEVGTGKTTLTRALLEQLPVNVDVALILNPKLSSEEFLAAICDELKVNYDREQVRIKSLVDALNAYLLSAHANGRRVVLIVDEAQNFQADVLEQIRLLTNLETTQQKLLQIILVGQPELRDLLARKELRQLAQRITARYHLIPMTLAETKGYVKHRLKVAGAVNDLFTASAIRQLWRHSAGVPRLVNILADRALLGAYSAEVSRVTPRMVNQAHNELNAVDLSHGRRYSTLLIGALMVVLLMVGGGVAGYFLSVSRSSDIAPTTVAEIASNTSNVKQDIPGVGVMALQTPVVKTLFEGSARIFTAEEFTAYLISNSQSLKLNAAFRSLFTLWQIDYSDLEDVTGCEKALLVRKRCYWGSGSWSDFLMLNRSALVWLVDPTDEKLKYYFVITSISDGLVEVEVGDDQPLYVQQTDFERFWPAKYLVLWQPPSLDFDIVRPGGKGNLVLWLRRNIERILNQPTLKGEMASVYDGQLLESVKQFQRQQGLDADGLVGELTMLHLNSVLADESVPLLVRTAGAE